MILADTSAWVEYDRATGSRVHIRLRDLIKAGDLLAVTEPVLMEVMAGARSVAHEEALRRLMLGAQMLPFETPEDFEGAARLYRQCRVTGITPRGFVDCMIAVVAKRSGASLLSNDLDIARISSVIGVDLDPASLRAN